MQLTTHDLEAFASPAVWFMDGLQTAIDSFGINTPARLRYFLAQTAHESQGFTHIEENLNYSAGALVATFPKHFTAAEAANYAHNPLAIANRAYANRDGNGDEASGDGWKYHGRGLIQITGKANYAKLSTFMGLGNELVVTPEMLMDRTEAATSAGAFFAMDGLNHFADIADFEGLTKAINGGLNGLTDRQTWLQKAAIIWPD